MVLMVFFSSRISPFTSTVIFLPRSPLAMAVATSAMLRTWAVRFDAIRFTLSVKSFQVPATSDTKAWPPSLPSVPTSRATPVTSEGNTLRCSPIALTGSVSRREGECYLDRQVAGGDGGGHVGDVAHLGGEVRRHQVHALGEVLPHAGDLAHLRLAAELALGADLARHARHLGGEHAELLDHGVDDGGRAQELALKRTPVNVETHGLQEIALGDGGDGAGDFGGRPKQVVDQGIDRGFHL